MTYSAATKQKLNANVLLLVVVLALVCGLLSSSILFLGYYHRHMTYEALLMKRLDLNVQSVIEWTLASPDSVIQIARTWDLFGEQRDSVTVTCEPWGIYETGSVTAFSGKARRTKTFLTGRGADAEQAIYLSDQGIPLSLSGNTSIKGFCRLPRAGVQSVDVEGVSYSGTELIQGKVGHSSFELPQINNALISRLSDLFELNSRNAGDGMVIIEASDADTLTQAFNETKALLFQPGVLELRGVYRGKLIIRSDSLVRIASEALLDGIIVVAPAIVVQDGFQGNAQLFATDSIRVGADCSFEYPSAIGLIKSNFRVKQPFISIGQNTRVTGVLMASQRVQDLQQTLIQTGKNCLIIGQIYTDGYLELHGKLHGEVICRSFILKTPSSIYENYLADVVIDQESLPRGFVGAALIPAQMSARKIVKWL